MTARARMILAVVAAVLVSLLVFFFVVNPRRNELSRVRTEVQVERDRTQQLEAELDRLRELQENAPRFQAELAEIREFVPRDDEVPNFIFQAQQAANASGVGFVQITPELPKQPPEGAPLAEVRMTVGARGGYFAIQDFIRRLYDLDRAVRIDNVTMTGREEEEEETAAEDSRIDLVVISRIFFELPAGAVAPTTEGVPEAGAEPAPAATPEE